MKEIPLTQGKVALVDDEDYEYLSQFKWCAAHNGRKTYYAHTWINYKITKMHQLIMPDGQVDHIDRNGLNNCRSNLRYATTSQNVAHGIRQKGKNKYRGVEKRSESRWIAAITVDYKKIYLGSFGNELDAAKAYNAGAIKYFGEFATLNQV